jgi:hypothetical protein
LGTTDSKYGACNTEWWDYVNDNLGRIWKEALVAYFKYCPGFFLAGLKENWGEP